MSHFKQIILLLLTTLSLNLSRAQEISLSKDPIKSVDIAALYISETIIKAAKQMPEKYYSFKPKHEVRSFGELMAHIAESIFEMTALAKGETTPVSKVNTSKTDVIKALETCFEYSSEARKSMTKEQKETSVKFMGGTQLAGNVLDFSIFHSLQHYGNAIVYMRLKGLVPPSSQSENPDNNPIPVKQKSKEK